jgi:hypothetical protein
MLIWERAQRGALCDIAGVGAAVGGAAEAAGTAYAAGQAADATKYASNQTSQTAANSLAFNKQVYDTTLSNEQPYLSTGATAESELGAGLANGSLTQAYPGGSFQFSGVNLQNDPAYQFDLGQGEQAIQRSAAATGGLVSGGALRDLNNYAQGYASNQYQQSYTNALAAYQQAYQQYETTQANTYNRLAGTAGLGQNAATQTATSGNSAAGTNAAVNSSTANALAGLATGNAAAQGAAGIAYGNIGASTGNGIANALALSNSSSYGPSSGSGGLFQDSPAVSPSQWASYDAGSTPGATINAF